jgi:hypothetical protein
MTVTDPSTDGETDTPSHPSPILNVSAPVVPAIFMCVASA